MSAHGKNKFNAKGGGLPSMFASTINDTDKIGQRRFSSTQKYVQKDVDLGTVIGQDLREKFSKQISERFEEQAAVKRNTRVGINGKMQVGGGRKKGGLDIFALMDSALESGPTEEAKQKAREEAAARKAIEEMPIPKSPNPKTNKVGKTKSDLLSPKPDIRSPKPDLLSPKPDVRSLKPDLLSPKPDVRSPAKTRSGLLSPAKRSGVPIAFASSTSSPATLREPAWKLRLKSVEKTSDKAEETSPSETKTTLLSQEPAAERASAEDRSFQRVALSRTKSGPSTLPRPTVTDDGKQKAPKEDFQKTPLSQAKSFSSATPSKAKNLSAATPSGLPSLFASSITSPSPSNKDPAWKARMKLAQQSLTTPADLTATKSPVATKSSAQVDEAILDQHSDKEDSSVSISDIESEDEEVEQSKTISHKVASASLSTTDREPTKKARLIELQQAAAASTAQLRAIATKAPLRVAASTDEKNTNPLKQTPVPVPEGKNPAVSVAKTTAALSVADSIPKIPKRDVATFVSPPVSTLASSNDSDQKDRSAPTSDSLGESASSLYKALPPALSKASSPAPEIGEQEKPVLSSDSSDEEDNYPSAFKFTATPKTNVYNDDDSDSSSGSEDDDIRKTFQLGSGDGRDTEGLPSADIDFSVDPDQETRQFIFALDDAMFSSKSTDWYREQMKEAEKRLATSLTNHKLQKAELKKLVDRKKESLTDIFDGKMEVRRRLGAKQDKTFQRVHEDEQKIVESLRKENKRVRGEVNKLPRQIMELKYSILNIEAANTEIEGHLESLGTFAKKLERDHERLQASSAKCRDQYLPRYRNELRQREMQIDGETRIKNMYRNCILKISRYIGERKRVDLQEVINEMILETEADVNPKFDPAILFESESDSNSDSDSDSDSDSTSSSDS